MEKIEFNQFLQRISSWNNSLLNPKKSINQDFLDKNQSNYHKFNQNLEKGLNKYDALKYLPFDSKYAIAYFIQFPNDISESNIKYLKITTPDWQKIKVLNCIDDSWYQQYNLCFQVKSFDINYFYKIVIDELKDKHQNNQLPSFIQNIIDKNILNKFIDFLSDTALWGVFMIPFFTILFMLIQNKPTTFIESLPSIVLWIVSSIMFIFVFILSLHIIGKLLFTIFNLMAIKDFSRKKFIQTWKFASYFSYLCTDMDIDEVFSEENNEEKIRKIQQNFHEENNFNNNLIAYSLYHTKHYHPYIIKAIAGTFSQTTVKTTKKSEKSFTYNYHFLTENELNIDLSPFQSIIADILGILKKNQYLKYEKLDLSNYSSDTEQTKIKEILINYKQTLINSIMV